MIIEVINGHIMRPGRLWIQKLWAMCYRDFLSLLTRPGKVSEDVQSVLQRGDGRNGGLWHHKELHLRGCLSMEAGPRQERLSGQRTSGACCPAGQQMWRKVKGRRRGVLSGRLLRKEQLRGLVRDLCKGVLDLCVKMIMRVQELMTSPSLLCLSRRLNGDRSQTANMC